MLLHGHFHGMSPGYEIGRMQGDTEDGVRL